MGYGSAFFREWRNQGRAPILNQQYHRHGTLVARHCFYVNYETPYYKRRRWMQRTTLPCTSRLITMLSLVQRRRSCGYSCIRYYFWSSLSLRNTRDHTLVFSCIYRSADTCFTTLITAIRERNIGSVTRSLIQEPHSIKRTWSPIFTCPINS